MFPDRGADRDLGTDDTDAGNFSGLQVIWRQANHAMARAATTTALHMRRSSMIAASHVAAEWLLDAPKIAGTRFVDWKAIAFEDALRVTLRLFEAAQVPSNVLAEIERQANLTQLVDEQKSAYQRYLDQLGASRRGYPSLAHCDPIDPSKPLDRARLRKVVESVRNVSAFHRAPPTTLGLPDALAPMRELFESLGDVEDGPRLDIVSALDAGMSRALLAIATPRLATLDDWLAAPAARARPDAFAAAVATRLTIEHLAVRLALLEPAREVNRILEGLDADGKLAPTAEARLLQIVDAAHAGPVTWALDARDVECRTSPRCDDFAPMLNDVLDEHTVNNVMLFKAERSLGHRRLVADSVSPELAPLLPVAEVLDVGGDVGTHVVASALVSQRARDRIRSLAESHRRGVDEYVWSAWRGAPPSRPEWLAIFALSNMLNHWDAPEDTRREHEHLFAQVAAR